MNTIWEVSPKIAIIDGCLKVLTCKCHDKGSDDIMIHTYSWVYNLAAYQSDQIAQVVTQSRSIKFGKKATYSNEWQIMEQCGSFAGLDTCTHVEFGRFEKYSILRFDLETREIYNRFNINAHLNVLCKKKTISKNHANTTRKDAENACSNKDFIKLYTGEHMFL